MSAEVKQRLAFDQRAYLSHGEVDTHALTNDAKALGLEADPTKPVHVRIVRTVEVLLPDGSIVQPRLDKTRDVVNSFYIPKPNDSKQDRQEKQSGTIFSQTTHHPDGTVALWVSPEGGEHNYTETRLRVAVKRTVLGYSVIETYGIPLVDVNPVGLVNLFNILQEFTFSEPKTVTSPDELRAEVLHISAPDDSKGIDFLSKVIPQDIVPPEVWRDIKNGTVTQYNRKALHHARQIVKKLHNLVDMSKTYGLEQSIVLGSLLEVELIKAGYNIKDGVCGILNLKLLSAQTNSQALASVLIQSSEKWSYEPGVCKPKGKGGCGEYKLKVGPCGLCDSCEKKYS